MCVNQYFFTCKSIAVSFLEYDFTNHFAKKSEFLCTSFSISVCNLDLRFLHFPAYYIDSVLVTTLLGKRELHTLNVLHVITDFCDVADARYLGLFIGVLASDEIFLHLFLFRSKIFKV